MAYSPLAIQCLKYTNQNKLIDLYDFIYYTGMYNIKHTLLLLKNNNTNKIKNYSWDVKTIKGKINCELITNLIILLNSLGWDILLLQKKYFYKVQKILKHIQNLDAAHKSDLINRLLTLPNVENFINFNYEYKKYIINYFIRKNFYKYNMEDYVFFCFNLVLFYDLTNVKIDKHIIIDLLYIVNLTYDQRRIWNSIIYSPKLLKLKYSFINIITKFKDIDEYKDLSFISEKDLNIINLLFI